MHLFMKSFNNSQNSYSQECTQYRFHHLFNEGKISLSVSISRSSWQPCVTKPYQYFGLDQPWKEKEIPWIMKSNTAHSQVVSIPIVLLPADAVQRWFFSTCVVVFWSELRPVANSRLLSRRFKSALLASPQVWLCVPEHLRLLRYKFMYNNFDKYIERVLTNPLWLHQPQCVYRST